VFSVVFANLPHLQLLRDREHLQNLKYVHGVTQLIFTNM